MVINAILSDIRLALAVGIFTTGWAFGIVWCLIFWLIGKREEVRKMACKKKGKGKKLLTMTKKNTAV